MSNPSEPVAWMNPSIDPPMFIAHWAKVEHGAVFAGGGYTAAYTIPLYVAAPAGEPSADPEKQL